MLNKQCYQQFKYCINLELYSFGERSTNMENKVIITGFGPFGEHQINASWEAVKLIPSKCEEKIDLIIEEVPVVYTDVDAKISELWARHNPKLVIHVGVSNIAKLITVESKAKRCGYQKVDCRGNTHPSGEVCSKNEGEDTIHCQINVEEVCKSVNEIYGKSVMCTSTNAGRYLCEYIFYKSLNMDNRRTMFIHVPPLDKPFSADELAEAIMQIIKVCLLQLNCICEA